MYNEVKINIKMLKDTFKLKKVFGQDKLYQFELIFYILKFNI